MEGELIQYIHHISLRLSSQQRRRRADVHIHCVLMFMEAVVIIIDLIVDRSVPSIKSKVISRNIPN
jgi:hypothetical protein